jgi:uncharacterized protein (TIGR00730 family)
MSRDLAFTATRPDVHLIDLFRLFREKHLKGDAEFMYSALYGVFQMKSIGVYCGSSFGKDEKYRDAAVELGELLARREITLVYGGGRVGLMGVVADAVIGSGGRAIGVIPKFMAERELQHDGLSELVVVKTMHERKMKMAELSDGFIAMPGGFGTFEEIFEAITWGQLRIHNKPCAFLNAGGYYDLLRKFIEKAVEEQFIHREHFSPLIFSDNPIGIIEKFESYVPPSFDKMKDALEKIEDPD